MIRRYTAKHNNLLVSCIQIVGRSAPPSTFSVNYTLGGMGLGVHHNLLYSPILPDKCEGQLCLRFFPDAALVGSLLSSLGSTRQNLLNRGCLENGHSRR